LNSSVVSQNINVLASTTIGCLGGQGGGSYVGTVTINPATTLTVKTPANLTISGGLSGSGTLTTSSGGNTYRLFLGGDNSNFAGTILPGPASLITFTSASAGSSAATFQAGHAGGNLAFLEWGGSSSATVKLGALTDGGYSTGYVQNQNPSNNTTGTFEIGSLGTDTTFSGTIRDSYAAGNSKSAITKVGSGILTLTGTATHTGGTTITSGTLRLGNGTSSNGTLTGPVTNNATFMVANPSDQSLISPIGGSGGLVKSGAGTLTLSGQNTYLGPTTITQGTLRLAASQILLPSNLDVMPTGDSITFGANGGYRSPLFSSIQAIAPGFHFVGDSTLNPGTLPAGQQNHAGHSSYSSIDIHNNLDGLDLTTFNTYGDASRNPNGGFWLTGRTADANGPARDPLYPDVILLLVGANDIFRLTMNAQQAHDSYTALLTKITTLRPDAHVFMAKITPHANATQNQKAIAYNAVVAQVYDEFKAAGKNVTLVDLHTGYTGGLPDSLHPDAAGYAWMAGKWRDALVSALGIASVVTTALPAASSVTVAAGATLDLNHTEASIAGLNVSGTVSLGSGKLSTAAPASFAAGSALATRINRDNQTAGRLAVTGNLTLGNAALNLAITGTAALNPDTKFTLASYTGNLAGTFNGLPEGGVLTVSGTPFILRYADGGKNITLTVTTPYQSWISTQHPALTGNDCQPIADPDGDGLVNLIEYALGLNPQIANPNPIQFDKESVGADTYLRLSVARDPDASGVLIEGQVAETLAPGSWSSESVVIELTPPTEFRVRDSVPMSASSRRFMRLRFSQQ
jgi:autotransporter-associated beta strand protein